MVPGVVGVDCSLPHENQVYAVITHPASSGEPYPGEQPLLEFAYPECLTRFGGFVGEQYELSVLEFGQIRPTIESWEAGDRSLSCYVFHRDEEKLTTTAQGIGR